MNILIDSISCFVFCILSQSKNIIFFSIVHIYESYLNLDLTWAWIKLDFNWIRLK